MSEEAYYNLSSIQRNLDVRNGHSSYQFKRQRARVVLPPISHQRNLYQMRSLPKQILQHQKKAEERKIKRNNNHLMRSKSLSPQRLLVESRTMQLLFHDTRSPDALVLALSVPTTMHSKRWEIIRRERFLQMPK